jgi:hypothetical protein
MQLNMVRPSLEKDAYELAPRLRKADLEEVDAASGENPLEALIRGYEHSYQPFTILVNDRVAGMFGAVPLDQEFVVGAVWLLGSDDIFNVRMPFARQSRLWVDVVHKPFSVLTNWVDERNCVHVRWLKWVGFKFIAKCERFGYRNLPFYEFVKIK